jgi:hypothetical protein
MSGTWVDPVGLAAPSGPRKSLGMGVRRVSLLLHELPALESPGLIPHGGAAGRGWSGRWLIRSALRILIVSSFMENA